MRSADHKVQETQGPVPQSPHQVNTPHVSRQHATLPQARIPDLEVAHFCFRNQLALVQVVLAV